MTRCQHPPLCAPAGGRGNSYPLKTFPEPGTNVDNINISSGGGVEPLRAWAPPTARKTGSVVLRRRCSRGGETTGTMPGDPQTLGGQNPTLGICKGCGSLP